MKMTDKVFVISGPPNILMPNETSLNKCIYEALKRGGDAVALIDGVIGKTMSYSEILQQSVNLATSLRRMGLGKGDIVCISSENRMEFVITAYAVIFIGGAVTTLNPSYTTDEIKHALNLSKPRLIFCSPLTVNTIRKIAENVDYVENLVLYGNDQRVKTTMYCSLIVNNGNVNTFSLADVDPVNDHVVILYSSGTTGLPKGVMLTHSNFLHCAGHLRLNFGHTGRIKGQTTVLCVLPFFHAYGFVLCTLLPALHYKFTFAKRFEEEQFLSIVQDYKINLTFLVPPLMLFLAKHPSPPKYDLSSLKEIWCGAAPLSKELIAAVHKRLSCLEIIKQGYGMTELTLAVLYDFSRGIKQGSSGLIAPDMKVKVVDLNTGKDVGPGKEGELCLKGGLVMKGYVGDLTSTSALFDDDGWLHTGDIGYYDSDNYFYVIDRLKELIKYKGFQVPPAEIEAILLQHKGVKDAAVISVPDVEAGELPLAFVVRQENSYVSERELYCFVSEKVSSIKRLRGGVRFIEEIPKNPSGKILRRKLRELLKQERTSKL